MRFAVSFLAMLALLLPFPASAADSKTATTSISAERIETDAIWAGDVVVEKPLTIPDGVKVVVRPGSVVRFRKGSGLNVEGVLLAEGTKEAPITFTSAEAAPAAEDWLGVQFNKSGKGTSMAWCNLRYAVTVTLLGCSPEVTRCDISDGTYGIVADKKSSPEITANRIHDMAKGGIICRMDSSPYIMDNTIEGCPGPGIDVSQNAMPYIKGNTIAGCDTGINLNRAETLVEDNTVKGNKAGIVVTTCGVGLTISGNRVVDNLTGIACQQFSKPMIEKNLISGGELGIICVMSSSPMIRHNEITANKDGIRCEQICRPIIAANEIHDNQRGIYLNLSSYAVLRDNNIYANPLQMELVNMSADWENRVRNKPQRGLQAQNTVQANRGIAVRQAVGENDEFQGFVDATGNWWGEQATAEMVLLGPDADIAGFKDYHDQPTMTYEGFEGEYVQDRIRYEGWLNEPVKGAGI